jgi:oligosaccharide repeat unit polymerase
MAGGASRADAAGQVIVRATSAGVLVIAALWSRALSFASVAPVGWLLLAAMLFVALQLVPLPPGLWEVLPGRESFYWAKINAQESWRPWAIVPSATLNALFSLIVPGATLLLMACVSPEERARLLPALLALIALSMLVGLLQFTGASLNNPLVNDTPGVVAGSFANRNHLALFLALGCLLAPVWVFASGRRPGWRAPVGVGLLLLFALTILATGSRAGMILGMFAITIGFLLSRRGLKGELRRYPRWVFLALIVTVVALIAVVVLLSIAADRAVSIERLLENDVAQDMRGRGLPVVLAMIRDYFPVGFGFGSFDAAFRMHEPFELLKPTYFNHAHSDFLEVILDAGLPGVLLLIAVTGWWAWASIKAWRPRSRSDAMLPRLGSAMLLLVMLASTVDYPARTPMIMAVVVIAAVWLSDHSSTRSRGSAALPDSGRHL